MMVARCVVCLFAAVTLFADGVAALGGSVRLPVPSPFSTPGVSSSADDQLASLRRVADNIPDIAQVIARYQTFIAQNVGTPAADEARRDLFVWRQRQEQGQVKFGGRWMMPAERQEIALRVSAVVEQAKLLLRTDRVREADRITSDALKEDPQSLPLLYLRSVILLKQEQNAAAKRILDQLRVAMPGHAGTLNNLAVIVFQQGQPTAAVGVLEQALTSDPNNRTIIDNAAIVLHAVGEEVRKAGAGRRLADKFRQQDLQLQGELGKQGLKRWGGAWVTEAQLQEFTQAEAAAREKIDKLRADYDRDRQQLLAAESRLSMNRRLMNRLTADALRYDLDGRLVRFPLPMEYFELRRESDMLLVARLDLIRQIDGYPAQIRQAEQEKPKPVYPAKLSPIGGEGTPPVDGLLPATRPANPLGPGDPPPKNPLARPATSPSD